MRSTSLIMKIGIDGRMYGPQQTGIGNYIKYLIAYLEKLDTRNEYIVFLRQSEFQSLQFQNPRFSKVLADIPWYSFAEQTRFLSLLVAQKLDSMHFPHFNVPLFYRQPFVTTIHDVTPKRFPGEKVGKSWIRRQSYHLVLRHAVLGAKAIIAPSQVTRQDIVTYFPQAASSVEVIYEGIPLPPASLSASPLRSPYILYVGVWRSHKNIEGLLKAFALLKKRKLPHKLALVGDPDIYYHKIETLWKSLGLDGQIIVPGFQSDTQLDPWYRHASLLVLPSFSEGFGLTPLVALSLGVPVAVSNIPVLKEVLGKAAFYFSPNDPFDMAGVMKNAIKSPSLTQAQLAAAKDILSRYSWEKMAQKTLAILEKS